MLLHSVTTRRRFLKFAAVAASFPTIIPNRAFGANDRIQVGIIGTGFRGNLLIDQLPAPGELVAAADCHLTRCEDAATKRKAKWDVYQDYRRILDRKDIDAVIVATPDHDRVLVCIHACQAGKDIYAEKPLTLYIGEGRELVKAVRNRIEYAKLDVKIAEEYKAQLDSSRTSTSTRLHNAAVEGYQAVAENLLAVLIGLLYYGPVVLIWCAILFFPARYAWRRLARR